VTEIPGGIGPHGAYIFLENNRLIADSRGNVWDVASGCTEMVLPNEWTGNWIDVSSDESRAAVIHPHGYVFLIDRLQRKLLHNEPAHHDHGRAIEYSPDGKLIASAAERVLLWDAATMTRIAPLDYESIVWSVAFSPDGRWLVSTHGDGSILIWDVLNRELEANLRQHSGGVRAVAFSEDGKRVASGSEDHSVILWDSESGRKEAVFTTHQTRVERRRFRLMEHGLYPQISPAPFAAMTLDAAKRAGL
jgi:WD40 repeat protein